MNSTTENFWEAWHSFKWPEPKPIFYRAYRREDDSVFFTMEDLPGEYVEIDLETYKQGDINVKIIDGKVVKVTPQTYISKLTPNTESGTACDPTNVCIVVDRNRSHVLWDIKSVVYDN